MSDREVELTDLFEVTDARFVEPAILLRTQTFTFNHLHIPV